jgi:hypothetical protein
MDLKEEDILGANIHDHWYYTSKGRALHHFLGDIKTPEVLDVGAGSGIFSRQLLDEGVCESAVCLDPNYSKEKTETHNGQNIQFIKTINHIPQKLILMMDVLEHIPDDLEFLKGYVDRMQKEGFILITVPAFQFMWSGHDIFLEHHRRYTIKSLEKTVENSGLTPVRCRYFFGSLFAPIAAIRLFKKALFSAGKINAQSDLKLYPNWLNRTLIATHNIERRYLFDFNRLFGLSIFCLCRKD